MPDISKITLPSGTTYDIKDATAREMISGGVSFIVAWDGNSTPVVADIPAGVVVKYNGTNYTGTMAANDAEAGAFYLVKSATTTSGAPSDSYDEYVPVGTSGSKTWEKIGDTQVDLSDVVTNVTLTKGTDTVIGSDATFTVTQPGVTLSTGSSGDVDIVTGLGAPSTDTFLKGVQVTAQPTVTLTANTSTATGRITYVQSQGTATTTKLSATASGGAVSASGDNVTALTGLGTASTKSAIGANSTFTITQPTIALSENSATATGRVQVATGSGTASSTNTDWLKGVSVSGETLTIGAATPATTYLGASASGANTAWNSKDAVTAVTGYSSPSTDTVLGTGSTFSVTDPSITISSGSAGDVTVATGINSATTRYLSAAASGTTVGANGTGSAITDISASTTKLSATASGANVAWNSKDQVTVVTDSGTSITVTKGE